MKPDLTLPEKLCRYVINADEIRDVRTNATVEPRRDGYQYATDWFAVKVKEVQDYLNKNENARRHAPSATMIVVDAVFTQLVAEAKKVHAS